MSDDLYDWHIAPVSNAFASRAYPPSPIVVESEVGYSVQRYIPKVTMGERVSGHFRYERALEIAEKLNAGERHSLGLAIFPAYL